MRKKIATLLLAFALILPCSLLFTACGNDDDKVEAKVTSIAVTLVSTDYTMTDNTITVPYGVKVELAKSDFTVTATLDNSETKVIPEKDYTFLSTIPNDAITPIGDYEIKFSHEDLTESLDIDVKVVKADVDMTGVDWDYENPFTYNEDEYVVELTDLPAGVSVEYRTKLSTDSGYGEVGNSATNAGTYTTTAIFTYSDTENYNAIPNKVLNWEIKKADVEITAVTTQSYTYESGVQRTATITSTLPSQVKATITGDNTKTDAGTYNIVVSFELLEEYTANYNLVTESLQTSWTISPAKFTAVGEVVVDDDCVLTYNGENQTVVLDETGLDTTNVRVVNRTGITGKNPGKYYAVLELEYIGESGNYDRVDSIQVEWSIAKAHLTIKAKNKTITYGDSATNDGVEYIGLVAQETSSVLVGSLVYDYDGYEVGSSAGSYDITLTSSNLTSANYEISFEKGTLTVERKDLTIKANNVTIDYNTDATDNGVQPTGLIPNDTVEKLGTLTYSYGGYEKGKDVGSYDITVSGLDETNYIISYVKGILTVEKINVNIDVSGIALVNNVLTYTGAELEVEVDETTLPDGVSVTNIITRDKVAINVDEEYVAVIYLQYEDTANYNPMEEITRTWSIVKATVGSFDNVALSVNSLTYTGVEQTVGLINIPAGATIGSISGNKGTKVDEYTVEVTFVCGDADNYNDFEPVVKTYTWNITPATLTVTAKDHTIKYNENPSNNGYTITGFVNNENEGVLTSAVTYSYTYEVGDNVGDYEIIPAGATADNYTIEFVNGKLEVEKAEIDFANINWVEESPYTYNENGTLPVLNNEPENVEITYSYTQGGEVVEVPTNVGTYIAHVEIKLENDNYVIVNNNIVDFEYEIIPLEVDCSTLAWTDLREYTFDGEEQKPTLIEEFDGLEVTYSYYEGEDTQTIAQNVINVGTYTASVMVRPLNANYTLLNYTELEDIAFVINKMQIDVTAIEWEDTDELVYTGEGIELALIGTEGVESKHLTLEIFYNEGSRLSYPVKDVIQEMDITPVNAGSYTAYVFFTFAYDVENYQLMRNGYNILYNYIAKEFTINEVEAVLDKVEWVVEDAKLELSSDSSHYQYYLGEVTYTEDPITIDVSGNFDMFDVKCYLDSEEVNISDISLTEVKVYNINVELTLKQEYEQNYWFGGFTSQLQLEVKVNPFDSIFIDGEAVEYKDFMAYEKLEYGTEITFTLKEGYTAYSHEAAIESLTITEENRQFEVRRTEDSYFIMSKYFDMYYFDQFVVNGQNVNEWMTVVKLEKDQTSFEIDFDERYLTKYNSMITYESGMEYSGVIESRPFVVTNADEKSSIMIRVNDVTVLHIEIQRYSAISEISYTIVTMDNYKSTEKLDYYNNEIYLSEGIITDLTATVEDGYTVKYCANGDFKKELDLTDLNTLANLNTIAIVVYDGEEVFEVRHISLNYTMVTTDSVNIFETDVFNISENEFSLTFNCETPGMVVTSLLKGSETLELTEDVTVANYLLTVVYEEKTYTYSKQVLIVKTLKISECFDEDTLINGIYLQNTKTRVSYEIDAYSNSIDLKGDYDASTIKNLDVGDLEFPEVDGYTVSEKSLESANGKVLLKITLTSDQQAFSLTESEYVIYLLLKINGRYDNDTSAIINIYDAINGNTVVDGDATSFEIDISTQKFDVQLNNDRASVELKNGDTVLIMNMGYLGVYTFTELGTYTLNIIATDGTVKPYTINVTGEILPMLEIKVGEHTLTQEADSRGWPTEGDFEWEVIDGNYSEMSFTTLLGASSQKLIDQGEVTITSVRSAMLAAATVYDNNGNEITSLNNFKLSVLGDETAPYVMFYGVSTVQGQTTTTYIYLYLCDEIPEQKVLEIVYGDTVLTESLEDGSDMPTGNFKVEVLSQTETSQEMMFKGYLGEFETLPETLTLDSIYCIYEGPMTDMIKGEQFTGFTDVTLMVGTIGDDTTPCVAYSILFNPAPSYTVTVYVVLYLIDDSEIVYPALITVDEKDYNLKLNMFSTDFGNLNIDMENGYLSIVVDKEVGLLSISLDKVWNDYSYMVLIGNAYEEYLANVENFELTGVYNSDFIDGLLAEGTQAFRVTDYENLTMTIPLMFENGLAYFDIAVEGFLGYIPEESVHGMSFIRVYVVIDGVGQLPEGDNDEGYTPEGLPADTEFTVVIGDETIEFENFVWEEGAYILTSEQSSLEIQDENEEISVFITTNLSGTFESVNGSIYDITTNEEMEIKLQSEDGMWGFLYNNTIFFIFSFNDVI